MWDLVFERGWIVFWVILWMNTSEYRSLIIFRKKKMKDEMVKLIKKQRMNEKDRIIKLVKDIFRYFDV